MQQRRPPWERCSSASSRCCRLVDGRTGRHRQRQRIARQRCVAADVPLVVEPPGGSARGAAVAPPAAAPRRPQVAEPRRAAKATTPQRRSPRPPPRPHARRSRPRSRRRHPRPQRSTAPRHRRRSRGGRRRPRRLRLRPQPPPPPPCASRPATAGCVQRGRTGPRGPSRSSCSTWSRRPRVCSTRSVPQASPGSS